MDHAGARAIPHDVPAVELGHHGPRCSVDAFVERYELAVPALALLATIVRGADTDDRGLTPESAGLHAAATGFQAISRDDVERGRTSGAWRPPGACRSMPWRRGRSWSRAHAEGGARATRPRDRIVERVEGLVAGLAGR